MLSKVYESCIFDRFKDFVKRQKPICIIIYADDIFIVSPLLA